MVSETLELIIRTTGASSAGQQIGNIGSQARAAQSQIASLNGTLALMRQTLVALSFIRVFEGIASSISQAQQINNQLLQITKTAADVPKAFAMFSSIATATHAPLAAVTSLGVQIARSSASYKMGAKDIGDAVTTIFNTFRLNGSDPATISNVTKDLKEIFSLGIVQGRQFRAVILQDQAEALVLAKYIHATGSGAAATNKELDAIRSKGQLPDIYETAMKHKGAFTGRDVLNANVAAKGDVDQQVSKLPTTLGQAFTDLQTKWLGFVTSLNNSGVFQPVIDFVEYLANNLPTIGVMILAAGSAWATWTIVRTVAGYVNSLSVAFMGATRAVAAFFSLSTAMASVLVIGFIAIGAIIAVIFGEKIAAAAKAVGGWGELTIRTLAVIGAVFETIFGNFGATAMNIFVVVGNFITKTFQGIINGVIDGINFLSTKLNTILPKGIQLGQIGKQDFGQMANPYAAQLQNSFQSNLASTYKSLEGAFGAQKKQGLPALKTGGQPADNTELTKDTARKAADALQSLEDMLAKFAGPAVKFQSDIDKMAHKIQDWTTATKDAKGNTIAPLLTNAAVAATFAAAGFDDYNAKTHMSMEYTQAVARELLGLKNTSSEFLQTQQLVNKALEINAIDQDQANKLIEDAQRKRDLYNLSLLKTVDAGIKIAEIDFASKKGSPKDIAQATTTKALGFDQAGDITTYNTQVATLNQLLAAGTISNGAYVNSLQEIQKAYLSTATDGISGFQKGLLDVQQTMFNTAGDAAKVLTDSFTGLQNSLVTFATTGKFNIHDMAQSILKDFDTLIVKQAIMQPLISVLGFGPGSSLGIGQPGGGLGGLLGGILGGSGVSGSGQLGSDTTNPMWVSIATNTGDIFGSGGLGGGSAGSSGGASGLGGAASGGIPGMFNQGGLLGSGGFFGNLLSGKGGGAGSASSGVLSAFSDIGSLFGFASGGSFPVGGIGGTDSQLVAFRASPDETVTVQTPQQTRSAQNAQSSPNNSGGVHVHLHGVQDYDSFKKSKGQMTAAVGSAVQRATKRNGM